MSDYREGQTATNKATGEQVVFRDGGWAPLAQGEDPQPRVERDKYTVAKSLLTPSLNSYEIAKALLPEGSVDTAIALGGGLGIKAVASAGKRAYDSTQIMARLRGTAGTTLQKKLQQMASSPAGTTAIVGAAGTAGYKAMDAISSTISDIFGD